MAFVKKTVKVYATMRCRCNNAWRAHFSVYPSNNMKSFKQQVDTIMEKRSFKCNNCSKISTGLRGRIQIANLAEMFRDVRADSRQTARFLTPEVCCKVIRCSTLITNKERFCVEATLDEAGIIASIKDQMEDRDLSLLEEGENPVFVCKTCGNNNISEMVIILP